MKVVIKKENKHAFYFYEDDVHVILTEKGLEAPDKAGDLNSTNAEVVTIDAPDKWVPGGALAVVDGNWVVVKQDKYDDYVEPVEQVTYKPISSTAYIKLVKDVSQMSNAEFTAYIKDTDPDIEYVRYIIGSVVGLIDINDEDTMAVVTEGLDYMAQHGHVGRLSAETFRDTIFKYWPKA